MTVYAKIEKQKVTQYPLYEGDIRLSYPQVSFPVRFIPPVGFVCVEETTRPTYDYLTQNINEGIPELNDGIWIQTWIVSPATPEEIEERQNESRERVKALAKNKLVQTDWVEMSSVTDTQNTPHLLNKQDFISYRNEIRKIVVNPPIINPEWPVEPTAIWSE